MDGFCLKLLEAVCLGTSLAVSGVCYYLYRKNRKSVDKLDDAPHLVLDKHLKDILNVTPGACLQYVVIEGAVQPVDQSLTSPFQKEAVGVLQKFMLTEYRLVWNSLSRSWIDSQQVVHQRVNTVPFVLLGSDDTTVKVLCPLQASGLHMETTYEKFHQVNHGFTDTVLEYIGGQKTKGQLETEEMLKVGAALTGVGELILDTDGSLSLRPPSNGSEYFLSITGFDTLRGDQDSRAGWWRVLAIGFALAGSLVLLWVGRRYYCHLRARWEREQERREFERLQAEASRTGSAEAHQDGGHLENVCVICLSQPRNCILLDCGHVCCCYSCYQALPQHLCPICRQNITRVVPLYHT
ncbi:mitochondrial ubiquitin ligase activator of nfkb 1-A isoform X2 [Betta splendens]|nr:mitochondrial ubiquitin ligase activator of nfkb 1-A isoform X2 [Betta splendens]